jgi:hypothetical protein
MYRHSKKYQAQVARLASARAAKERDRLSGDLPDYPLDLTYLRRIIEITDFDTGALVTHRIELHRSDRIDCYNVSIDGKPWKKTYWVESCSRRASQSTTKTETVGLKANIEWPPLAVSCRKRKLR